MVNKYDISKICDRRVQSFSYNIQCQNCHVKHHLTCINIKRDDISDMWYCPCCVKDILAYNHIDDDDDFHCAILEGISDCAFRLQEMNSKVFTPFEINDRLDAPFGNIDPDMQYYTDMNYVENMKCDLFWRCFQQENKQYRNKQTVIISSKYQKFTKAHWWLWIIYKLFAHKVLFYWT